VSTKVLIAAAFAAPLIAVPALTQQSGTKRTLLHAREVALSTSRQALLLP
jgi:hypothetical protein